MNTLLTKQQTNSKRMYGKQPGKPIVVPEHGIIIHKNHYSSQRGASTPRGIHMDLKAEMQVQDEEPKDEEAKHDYLKLIYKSFPTNLF